MADSIRINAGTKRILINDGPDFLEFNPSDVVFVEKFYKVIGEFQSKLAEYKARANILDENGAVGADGLPTNLDKRLAFIREVCEFTNGQIDYLFGIGTSESLFHGAHSLEMIEQFFMGLIPYVQRDRKAKLAKYLADDNEPADGETSKNN